MIARHLAARGRVQGVFFRDWMVAAGPPAARVDAVEVEEVVDVGVSGIAAFGRRRAG